MKKLVLSVIVILCFNSCYDNTRFLIDIDESQTIKVNSSTFEKIKRMVDDPSLSNIDTCIEFVYPLTIFKLDEAYIPENSYLIQDALAFSGLINSLSGNNYISISFPIKATQNNSIELEINNLNELEQSLNVCIREAEETETIGNCQTILSQCKWKVYNIKPTTEETELYLNNLLEINQGELTYEYDDDIFKGSWSPLYIEEEFHININLILEDEIETNETIVDLMLFWNHDWKVIQITPNKLVINFEDITITFKRKCIDDCEEDILVFETCELEENPGYAEFILQDYIDCIIDIVSFENNIPEENYLINSIHLTEEDALDLQNSMDLETTFTNTSINEQTLYAVVDNIANETEVVPFIIKTKICN